MIVKTQFHAAPNQVSIIAATAEDGLHMIEHLHKYKKKNLTKSKNKEPYFVFACIECSSTIRRDLIAGREARCFKCNQVFTVTARQATKQSRLRCLNCIKHKSETLQVRRDINELLDKILDEI